MAVSPTPLLPDRGALSARTVLRVVVIVLTVIFTIYLVFLLRRPLTWIFIAGFLAVALSGPVAFLERYMRRGLSIAAVYVALILIPIVIGAMLIPPVVEQLNNLINNLPAYVQDIQDFVERNEQLRQLEQDYNITAELQKQASSLTGRVGDAAGILSDIGLGLVNSIFAGVSILILSLFMIGSGRTWLDVGRAPPGRGPRGVAQPAVRPDRHRGRQLRRRRAAARRSSPACSRSSC